MFGMFKRKETIQSIAHQVPNVLLKEFGDKDVYLPDEVDKALAELGHDKLEDMTRYQYAYGMFTSLASYEQLGLTEELGNYGHFQRRLAKCFSTHQNRLICTSTLSFHSSIILTMPKRMLAMKRLWSIVQMVAINSGRKGIQIHFLADFPMSLILLHNGTLMSGLTLFLV